MRHPARRPMGPQDHRSDRANTSYCFAVHHRWPHQEVLGEPRGRISSLDLRQRCMHLPLPGRILDRVDTTVSDLPEMDQIYPDLVGWRFIHPRYSITRSVPTDTRSNSTVTPCRRRSTSLGERVELTSQSGLDLRHAHRSRQHRLEDVHRQCFLGLCHAGFNCKPAAVQPGNGRTDSSAGFVLGRNKRCKCRKRGCDMAQS